MTYIDIISGFTGSGKTTLIQNLLNRFYPDQSVFIIQNEIGAVKLDSLADSGSIRIKSILNGCLCCSNTGELETMLRNLSESKQSERIIIELSGMAQISDFLFLVQNQIKSEPGCISHVVTVVDLYSFEMRMAVSEMFFKRQLKNSPILFLSNSDKVPKKEASEIQAQLLRWNPNCNFLDNDLNNWEELELSHSKTFQAFPSSTAHSYAGYRIRPHDGTDSGTYPYIF